MAKKIIIAGELHSLASGNVVAASSAIRDYKRGKTQEEVNDDVELRLRNLESAAKEHEKIRDILPTEDLDGNGIPDGLDKLNRIEEAMNSGIENEDIQEAWNDVFGASSQSS